MNDGLVDSSIMLQPASIDRCVIVASGAEGMWPCHAPSPKNRKELLDAERSLRDHFTGPNYPHGA
jgi:hypothetical protein